MQVSGIHKAKTYLSELIKKAEAGEDVIICKSGKPVVKLVKFRPDPTPRKPGIWRNKITIAEDFDELPPNLLSLFKGE